MSTPAYKSDFIHLCLAQSVLRFGSFTLKSGRQSPYFFNAGLFSGGKAIAALGRAYAAAIAEARANGRLQPGEHEAQGLWEQTAAAMVGDLEQQMEIL